MDLGNSMKTGFNKILLGAGLLTFAVSAMAMPSSIVLAAVFGDSLLAAAALGATGYAIASFAINMVASAIITKAFFSPNQPSVSDGPNPGNPQQLPPATDNKLPVIYGTAWTGGAVVDLSITSNNQQMYYVIALCEVTGDGADTITFGDIYWGGKKVGFDPTDTYKVITLTDESTGAVDTNIAGRMEIYLYNNGSYSPTNSTINAIDVMNSSNLVYTWGSSKLMTNCAFAIVHLTYNNDAGTTGLQQTRFQITNSRTSVGDCFYDYLTNPVYGCAIPSNQINTDSLDALNTYCNELVTYTDPQGVTQTQERFLFDGVLLTSSTCMTNLQMMSTCCDCLLKYNEISGLWGVVVQSPTYTIAMDINDSNMVSSIGISPLDIASSYNIIEAKFANKTSQDAFDTAVFDLSQIDPSLLFPNEPVNKQSVNLNLVNNSVRAQTISTRMLKSSREDLQVTINVNYSGIQLEAGDIVALTSANYGWTAKPFRVNKIIEEFADDASVTAKLTLTEFNASIYDDMPLTAFQPSPNTGFGDPTVFGTVPTPTISGANTTATIPNFNVNITASTAGVIQYAEVWYSAFSSASAAQMIFAGTTVIQSNGNPYAPSQVLPPVNLTEIPKGDWYFFTRMVNSLGTSQYSLPSAVFKWRPQTYQFTNRYLAIAYADNATGTSGFSYNPRNKAYFGIYNNDTANGGTDPTLYTWYQANSNFGTTNYLLYANRQNRKFSLTVGAAGYLNLGGAFVPLETSVYDSTQWSGLIDPTGTNQSFIDLDLRTGQVTVAGATGNNLNDGFLAVTNNTDGSMKVNLHDFLNFGAGIYTKSFNAATLTIDIYGRVVGFTEADEFFYTETVSNATAGQTSFTFSHTVGWALVFRDGVLLDPSEYTETSSTVVMNTACAANEKVVLIYMRGVSTSEYYEPLNISIASSTSNSVTYSSLPWNQVAAGDKITFANTGSPTQYTVASVNQTTKVITFTGTISGATAGLTLYRYRAAGANYAPFTRYDTDVSSITSYAPTTWEVNNGFESIYVNGCQISEIDYNIDNGTNAISGFPSAMTGRLTVLMYTQNNLAVPASNIANTVAYTTAGQTTYPFASNPLSMEVYANGCLLTKGSGYDYTASASNYILTTAYNNNSTLLNQQTFARMGAA
jgi:hypothetical protein